MNCCTIPTVTPEAAFAIVLIAGCLLYAGYQAVMGLLGK